MNIRLRMANNTRMPLNSSKITTLFFLVLILLLLESCNNKLHYSESTKLQYLKLAETFLKNGEYSKAYKQVNKALKIDPNYGYAHFVKGNIFVAAADSCITNKENKVEYNDKLVFELAYLEYKIIRNDSIYSKIVTNKMDYLRPVIRDPETVGIPFGAGDKEKPYGKCYNWIKEKLPILPIWKN